MYWKKSFLALGCATVLTAGQFAGCVLPFGVSAEVFAEEAVTPSVSLAYQAVEAGQTLNYTLTGIAESEITKTQWFVDGTLAASADGVCGYTVKGADEESLISYKVTLSSGEVYEGKVYFSALPVLYLDCENEYDSFQEKTEEYAATTTTLVAKGMAPEQLYSGDSGIRLRGNSTAGLAKKPFKLKLDKKTDLLGMGKNKNWALLANAIDTTNMRNKLLLDFSGDIGAPTYMQSENVSVVFNGQYLGVYELCEQVRIGSTRVDIHDWEDTAEAVSDALLLQLQSEKVITKAQKKSISSAVEDELNADYSWLSGDHSFYSPTLAGMGIGFDQTFSLDDYVNFEDLAIPAPTGGALIEMDFYTGQAAELLTAYQQPYYFDTPENGATYTALHDYMKEYIQTVEYALHDTDFIYDNSDTHYYTAETGRFSRSRQKWVDMKYNVNTSFTSQYDHTHYSELLDIDSAVVNFLVCEYSRNWDSMKNSAFMYKDIDGKMFMGPAWDFDWAWGNSMYGIFTDLPEGWQTTDDYFANEQYYQSTQWNRYLIKDPYFLSLVYEKYKEIRPTVIEDMIKDGGLIDTYYEKYKNASHANDEVWGGSMGTYSGATYDDEVQRMKTFITTRVAWMDKQFTSLETLRKSLGGYVTSDAIKVESVDTGAKAGSTVITASTTNANAAKISFQINGTYLESADVTNGKAVLEVPDSALTAKIGQSNVVQVRALDKNGAYIKNDSGSVNGEYANAISNYQVFTKDFSLSLTEESLYELKAVSGSASRLSGVNAGTTADSLLANFSNTTVVLKDANGNTVSDSDKVKTGDVVQLIDNGQVTDEATVIVSGDVNGDGVISVLDMEDIQKSLLNITPLSEIGIAAGTRLLNSETLSVLDMEAIQKVILGIKE